MPVLAIFDVKGDSADLLRRYDRAMPRIMDVSPAKPLSHVCCASPEGLRIFDVWENAAALQAFAENPKFRAAIAEAGLPAPTVTMLEVHKTSW